MAYVYSHHKADTHEVFYIGISNIDNGKYSRAIDYNKRSKFWKSLVAKHGFYHKIIHDSITWDEAIKIEIELIAKHGRLNNKTGVLCNLTDGGEGCTGFPITEEYIQNCRNAQRGKIGRFGADNPFFGKKHTAESMAKRKATIEKNGTFQRGENNPNYGKKLPQWQIDNLRRINTGKKHTEEAKIKIRAWGKGKPKSEEWKAKVRGENNGWYGKGHLMSGDNSYTAKKCVLIETGEEFKCLKVACKKLGLSYNTQLAYIKKHHKRHKNRKFNYL